MQLFSHSDNTAHCRLNVIAPPRQYLLLFYMSRAYLTMAFRIPIHLRQSYETVVSMHILTSVHIEYVYLEFPSLHPSNSPNRYSSTLVISRAFRALIFTSTEL